MRGKLKGVKKERVKVPRQLSKSQIRKAKKRGPPKKKDHLVSVSQYMSSEPEHDILAGGEEEGKVQGAADNNGELVPPKGILNFAKRLANTEKSIRDRGFNTLGKFLKVKKHLPYSQYLLIWKGLYMCQYFFFSFFFS